MLFTLAEWHAYAKLRLHTDSTLSHLAAATKALGKMIRHFSKTTCEAYVTRELPGEQEKRARRKRAQAAKAGAQALDAPQPISSASSDTVKRKTFNLVTYKLHALGDYLKTIFDYGTSDSYSTQVVCFILFTGYMLINFLLINARESSNIVVSNDFMHGLTKTSMLSRSQNMSTVRDFSVLSKKTC